MIEEESKLAADVPSMRRAYLLFRKWAPWLLTFQIGANIVIAASSSHSWVTYVRDDFFYYLIVAQNLAAGHGSTFNGIVRTNGYHPLWLILLTMFSLFTSNGTAILIFVGAVCLGAAVGCFFWGREMMELFGVEAAVSSSLALWVAAFCCRKFYTGMEVVLATPLAFLVVLLVLRGRCMATGQKRLYNGNHLFAPDAVSARCWLPGGIAGIWDTARSELPEAAFGYPDWMVFTRHPAFLCLSCDEQD